LFSDYGIGDESTVHLSGTIEGGVQEIEITIRSVHYDLEWVFVVQDSVSVLAVKKKLSEYTKQLYHGGIPAKCMGYFYFFHLICVASVAVSCV